MRPRLYDKPYVDQMRELTKDLPELATDFSIVAIGGETKQAFAIWVLKDWSERTRSQAEIQQDLQARLSKVAGVQAFVFAPSSLPGTGGGLPISMVIQTTGDPSQVFEVAEEVRMKAQASGKFIIVQNSLAFDAQQVTITVDRDRAAALNLPVARHRHHACAACRRRLDRTVRPRFEQLRHHHAGAAEVPAEPGSSSATSSSGA